MEELFDYLEARPEKGDLIAGLPEWEIDGTNGGTSLRCANSDPTTCRFG